MQGTHPLSHMTLWSCGLLWSCHSQNYLFTITVPTVTKLGSMVTYIEGLLPVKSHDTLITRSCKITLQTKTPPPHCLWPPNLAVWWLTFRGSSPSSLLALQSLGLARLSEKLKTLYLHYHNVYNYEELPPITSNNPVIKWPFEITWQTKTLYLHYHSDYCHQPSQSVDLLWEQVGDEGLPTKTLNDP